MMRIHLLIVAASLVCAAASPALAGTMKEKHFDVWLRAGGARLVTGAISEDGMPISNHHRVFGAEFGEEPGEPFASTEPGFQAFDGTFLPAAEFRLNIADAVLGWNGAGFSGVDETMTLEFGPSSVTSADGFVAGFPFTADAAGGFHDHFDIILNPADGLRADPAPGIYLLPLQIDLTSGALGPTRTFYLVMNLGQEEVDHEAAIEWAEMNLVPAPGAAVMFVFLVVQRRRARHGANAQKGMTYFATSFAASSMARARRGSAPSA